MVLKEDTFTEIVTFEYIMWRKSYIGGIIRVLLDVTEETGKSGKGKILDILSAQRPYLYDDYTDLHGGIDSFCKRTTLEEIKSMLVGQEGTFEHDEKTIPPTHCFKLKEQFPLDIKPKGSPFGP
ncbi:MAG: hypothetical protein HA492_00495 [Candidatus Verstraetearchaeota archaeon]|nr:hypothetical protein [Candidatus Verstraetearchaeota archaeon]